MIYIYTQYIYNYVYIILQKGQQQIGWSSWLMPRKSMYFISKRDDSSCSPSEKLTVSQNFPSSWWNLWFTALHTSSLGRHFFFDRPSRRQAPQNPRASAGSRRWCPPLGSPTCCAAADRRAGTTPPGRLCRAGNGGGGLNQHGDLTNQKEGLNFKHQVWGYSGDIIWYNDNM